MDKPYHTGMENVIDILEQRDFIEALTSKEIRELVETPQTVFVGFDPTSDSLHLGSLIPIMGLAWFARAGHKPIALVGGATAMIGDPSGKSDERNLLQPEQIEINKIGIRANLRAVLKDEIPLVDNADWFKDFSLLAFLRDVGKYFRVGQMLSKESVKLRMESEEGMSFTEFTYQVLQGYDFLHLYNTRHVTIQMGGSDQWGNIVAGIELIRKVHAKPSFGITFPLMRRSDGKKFGKTEGGAIWLSREKTSPYQFYQYLYNVTDADVITLMKRLTFMPIEDINSWANKMQDLDYKPHSAQEALAVAVTLIVHGEEGLKEARLMTEQLVPGGKTSLDRATLEALGAEGQCFETEKLVDMPLIDLLVLSGLQSSKSEARRLIKNGGLSLNNEKVVDETLVIGENQLIEKEFLLVSVGKKTKKLIRLKTS